MCACNVEGGPTLFAFASAATEHLSLALLLVSTVTKAHSEVAAAAKQEERKHQSLDLITIIIRKYKLDAKMST